MSNIYIARKDDTYYYALLEITNKELMMTDGIGNYGRVFDTIVRNMDEGEWKGSKHYNTFKDNFPDRELEIRETIKIDGDNCEFIKT